MAIAHDSEVLGVANSTAGNYDTAITPTNTPSGVCVVIVDDTSASDVVTSVTYGTTTGAVTLTRRRFATEPTEPGGVFIYWAGGVTFPAGAQSVRVVRTGTDNLRAYIATMTCAAGQQVAVDVDNSALSAAAANPAVALAVTVGTTSCYLGVHSGITAMTSTPATGWTLGGSPGFEDTGAQGRGWARRLFTAGPGDPAAGWTIGSDDYVIAGIAFKEAPLNGPPDRFRGVLGQRYGMRTASIAANY